VLVVFTFSTPKTNIPKANKGVPVPVIGGYNESTNARATQLERSPAGLLAAHARVPAGPFSSVAVAGAPKPIR
jgi:hypothetical protein